MKASWNLALAVSVRARTSWSVFLLVGATLVGRVDGHAQQRVTVVATTDVHGRAMHWDYVADREAPWGLTRAATAVDSIRRLTGDPVILVDAGDLIQGNLFARFFGRERTVARNPMVDALNAMGYDAFTPGNHDFDFSVPFLDTALAYAQFNVVSANIYGGNRLTYREYVTIDRAGVTVGITGATTYGTTRWNRDQLRNQRVIRPIVPEVRRALGRMQAEGVHLKVVLVHSGLGPPGTARSADAEAANIAEQLAFLPVKPDLVILGHSHGVLADSMINGVHFIQAGPWARSLAVAEVTLGGSGSNVAVQFIVGRNVPLAGVRPDGDLVRRLTSSHEAARSWGALPIGTAPEGWRADLSRAQDTPIIDFINHVQLVEAGAQLSATPSFTTAGGFSSGQIRMRDVHAIYPFENTLKVVQISGTGLRQYIETSAQYFSTFGTGRNPVDERVQGYDYDMISGVDYVLDLTMPPGSRVRQLLYQGRLVRPDDRFSLAINSHRLVAGGFAGVEGLPVLRETTRPVFDLLVGEIRRVGTLVTDSYFESTWSIVPETAARAVQVAFGVVDSSRVERRAFRVVATGDLHGALHPRETSWSNGRAVGGVAALGGLVDSLSRTCACTTILVDAGGALGGTLAADQNFGSSVVQTMNLMRYDAAAVGESELFWGADTLRARIAESSFPWLAANTRLVDANTRPSWARDWIMVERGGNRIAVIGLTGGSSSALTLAGSDRFITTDMAGAVNGAIREARASGAQHVVVLAHGEAYCDREGCRGELIDFMESLEPGSVTLVVGGHSESEATTVINGIPLLLPGSRGLSVGVADIMVSPNGTTRAVSNVETVWVDSVMPNQLVAEATRDAGYSPDSIVTSTVLPISSDGEESGIGRLIADAYRNAARAHVAVVHNSVIQDGLPAGNVRLRDVYATQPVRHSIKRVLVRGAVIREVLEHALRGAAPTAHVSGVELEYDPNGRPGNRIRRIRLAGDRGFSNGDMYWLAISDFMARGGGGYDMLSQFEAESTGVSDFQALLTYLSLLPRPVDAPRNPRMRRR